MHEERGRSGIGSRRAAPSPPRVRGERVDVRGRRQSGFTGIQISTVASPFGSVSGSLW